LYSGHVFCINDTNNLWIPKMLRKKGKMLIVPLKAKRKQIRFMHTRVLFEANSRGR
jgi:hypothetical protein